MYDSMLDTTNAFGTSERVAPALRPSWARLVIVLPLTT